MLVSVIMPVYNKASFICEAIISILNQTYKNFELIIVDDGSSDRSAELVKKFNDSRIRLIQLKENHGVSYATNKALEAAKGSYILRMDADDISYPKRLEKQLDYAIRHQADVVGCKFEVFSDAGDAPPGLIRYQNYSNSIINPEDIVSNFTVMPTVLQGTMLVKKKVLEQFPFDINYNTAEDYEQLGRVLKARKRVLKIAETLYKYRYIKRSLSNTHSKDGILNGINIKLDFIYNYYKVAEKRDKCFFIWGTKEFAGYLEEELRNEKYQASVKGFIDFDSSLWGLTKNNLPIISPDEMIKTMKNDDIVITMWNIDRENIINYLEEHGLRRNISFFVLS